MRISRVSVTVLLLAFSACTQEPAMVELKGQNSYGQSTNTYAATSSRIGTHSPSSYVTSNAAPAPADSSTATQSNASVAPIGVSEVAAPAKLEKKDKIAAVTPLVAPAAKPQPQLAQATVAATPAPKAAPQQTAQAIKEQKINPWTNKPHASDAGMQQAALSDSAKAVTRFMWPVASKKVISGFGPKGGGKVNDGIDIASANGEPVWAAADGEVVYVGNGLAGYGNMVLIKHAGGKTTAYAHMGRTAVDKYDRVKQGDIIGYVGTSGNVKTPELHFAIRDGKEPVDPAKYISRSVAGL